VHGESFQKNGAQAGSPQLSGSAAQSQGSISCIDMRKPHIGKPDGAAINGMARTSVKWRANKNTVEHD
jgi:hypothetical protein